MSEIKSAYVFPNDMERLRKLIAVAVAGTPWDNDRIRVERSIFGIEASVSKPHATERDRWVMFPLAIPFTIDEFSADDAAIAIQKAVAHLSRAGERFRFNSFRLNRPR